MIPSPCGLLQPGKTLFLGTVEKSSVIDIVERVGTQMMTRNERAVHFRVKESFSGKPQVGEQIVIQTGWGGGDCGYPFKEGATYLVDASPYAGHLYTSLCSSTGTEADRATLLRQLRALVTGPRVPDLAGSIRVQSYLSDDEASYSPVADVSVVLTPESGGSALRAVTDKDGFYAFPALSEGKYTLTANLPKNLAVWQREQDIRNGKPIEIEIPKQHGGASACHYDVNPVPSGSVSGRVVDSDGRPAKGRVTVIGKNTHEPRGVQESDVDAEGNFSVRYVPQGAYKVEFGRNGNWMDEWYYPGAHSVMEAKTIEVGDGEQVQGVKIVVPSP
jgi:hypothetical protein